jgi:hypothetical protein
MHRFEKVLGRHSVDIPRQTLARWVIQCSENLQPLGSCTDEFMKQVADPKNKKRKFITDALSK